MARRIGIIANRNVMDEPNLPATRLVLAQLSLQPVKHDGSRPDTVRAAGVAIFIRPQHVVEDQDRDVRTGRMAHRVVAARGIGTVEAGIDFEIAQKLADGVAGGSQIRASGIDAVVAAGRVIVAKSDDDRPARCNAGKRLGDEDGRLDRHGLDER